MSLIITPAGGASVTNDTSTNSDNFFLTLADNQTSGFLSASIVSSTKLYYNPSTGQLNATNVNSLSDVRKKQNIKTIENSIDKVTNLRGVSFEWLDTHLVSIGVIAQEVEQVVPEVVSTSTSGEKSVNYGALVGLLIEAIKEQNIRIKKLELK